MWTMDRATGSEPKEKARLFPARIVTQKMIQRINRAGSLRKSKCWQNNSLYKLLVTVGILWIVSSEVN